MPGETYQTLKSKATQQAKQSGMSQSSAENYGSAMATQAAVATAGNTNPDFLGSNTNQIVDTVNEIKSNLNFDASAGQGGPAGMTFTEANESTNIPINASQAILTQLSNENIQQQIAKRREVEKQVQEAGGVFNPQTGVVEYPQKTKLGLGNFSLENIPSLTLQAGIGGAKALQLLLDKVFKPQASDFSNPNFLAVLNAAFKSGRLDKDEYTTKYENLIKDVYGGQGIGSLDQATGATSLDSEGLFDLAMEEATANVEPGSGTQRITDPKGFYLDDGQGILPQTSGALVDLANIAVTPEMQGTNPELVKMIFDARMELDRMNKNPMTGESQGQGGQGVTSIPSSGINLVDVPGMGPFKPFTGPYSNIPQQYAGFFDSPFNKPVAGGMAITPVQLPDGSTIQFGDTGSASQFRQYLESLGINQPPATGVDVVKSQPIGLPAIADYASMAPQFTGSPYTNQGVSPMLGDYYGNLRRFYG